jgi:hypothetical protein
MHRLTIRSQSFPKQIGWENERLESGVFALVVRSCNHYSTVLEYVLVQYSHHTGPDICVCASHWNKIPVNGNQGKCKVVNYIYYTYYICTEL